MQQTKYYCDHCEKEVQSKSELYLLKMALHKELETISTCGKEICPECINKGMGIDLANPKYDRYHKEQALYRNLINMVKSFFD